jgi:SPP1 gp7 family putative phage head morphogenesis protein
VPTATLKLEPRTHRRHVANVRRSEQSVRAVDRHFHRAWIKLLGLMAQIEASGQPPNGAMQQRLRALVHGLGGSVIGTIAGELKTIAGESYDRTADDLIRTLPRDVWISLAKKKRGISEGDSSLIQKAKAAAIRVLKAFTGIDPDYQAIIDGETLPEKGFRAMLKRILFPPPPKEKVAEILRSDRWPDRKTWPQRLREEGFSFDQIVNQVTTGFSQGEGIADIRKRVEPLVNNVRYRATRIARTESLRVASTMQREAYSKVDDAIIGYKINAVMDERTRPEHAERNGTVYWKAGYGDGAHDISELPELPDAPNCRCMATPLFAGIDE